MPSQSRVTTVAAAAAVALTASLLAVSGSADAATPSTSTVVASSQVHAVVDDGDVDTSADRFGYRGAWSVRDREGASGGSDHVSAEPGAAYELSCSCSTVQLHGPTGPGYGIASIEVDGTVVGTVDQYSAAARDDALLFSTPLLPLGDHVVTVTVTGTANPEADGTLLAVDRAVVVRQNPVTEDEVAEPAPAPEPAPAAPGSVVWQADASRPIEQEWGAVSTAAECAVVTVPGFRSARIAQVTTADSPSPTGRFYRATVAGADRCYGARAEMANGNPVRQFDDGTGERLFLEGQESWISFASRLAPDYPIDGRSWSLIHQWKQTAKYGGPDGNPVLSLVAYGGKYRMWGPGYSELHQQNPPTGAYGSWGADVASNPSLDQWHLFTMHVRWSPDPAKGYVALYGDLADGQGWRTLISGRNVSTMKVNDSGGSGETIPTHARAGIYRSESYTEGTHVDVAGYTVATSRAAAEAGAFRPGLRSAG